LELHGPVRFPGPSGVARGGLLPACGSRRDVAPDVARAGLHAVDDVVGIEGAGAVLEAADDRGADRAEGIALVEPPDGPLAGLRCEGGQGPAAWEAGGGVEDVVLGFREAVHDLVVGARAVELDPLGAAVGELLGRAVVDPPGADLEVEVAGDFGGRGA